MNIIFHIPFAIDPKVASGTNIRPKKLLDTMLKMGHQVEIISGNNELRKAKIHALKKQIKSGEKFDLLYSESSTLPTLLTEKHHFPTAPLLDFGFFNFCRDQNIPIGLYYRDIHWNFEHYPLTGVKKYYAHFFYHYDIHKYNQLLDVLFLQSDEMHNFIPGLKKELKIVELPPGVDTVVEQKNDKVINQPLKLIYVGGLSDLYQLHNFVSAAEATNTFNFTICTRLADWEMAKKEYEQVFTRAKNLHLIHESGEVLDKRMLNYDLASIIVKPTDYWSFVLPLKLFYYLSYQIPIIASKGTRAAKYVTEHDVGWVVEYNEQAIKELFQKIAQEPTAIKAKKDNIRKILADITWEARVNTIIKSLTC